MCYSLKENTAPCECLIQGKRSLPSTSAAAPSHRRALVQAWALLPRRQFSGNLHLEHWNVSSPNPTHLFENIFLDFDEGRLLVSALGSLHKLVRGFPHSVARLFQPLHALRPSVGLHLDSLVTSHIRANHIMNNFPLSPGTRALTGLLPCWLASPRQPSESHRSHPGRGINIKKPCILIIRVVTLCAIDQWWDKDLDVIHFLLRLKKKVHHWGQDLVVPMNHCC